MHLLIIDDDDRLRSVLARRFAAQPGFIVQDFSLASQALDAATTPVEAILLDMLLAQDEIGLDFVAPLVARFAPTHLIMMTGYASIATTVAAMKQGATDYVAKPVSFNELLSKLQSAGPVQPPEPLSAMTPAQAEWEHIQRMLLSHQGNISATAKALGMHRRTLQRKLQKHAPVKPAQVE